MAKRKHPGLVWRVLFGHNGPTKKALRKAFREWTGSTARTNAEASRIMPGGRLVQRNGKWRFEPPKPKKVPSAKKRTAEKDTRNKRAANQAAKQPRQPAPMTQRVQRKSNGTFNGSKPTGLTPAEREAARLARSANAAYNRAARSAAASERRIRREYGH